MSVRSLHPHPSVARILERPSGGTIMNSGGTRVFTTGNFNSGLASYGQFCTLNIRDNREQEKRELTELNNRLARYIEKSRFLQAQNRILQADIDLFRNGAALHAQRMSVVFEAEEKSIHTLIREVDSKRTVHQKNVNTTLGEIEVEKRRYAESMDQHQRRREADREQMRQLSQLEAEVAFMKRQRAEAEGEVTRIKSLNSRVRAEIARVKALRDKERSGLGGFSGKANDLLARIKASTAQHELKIREEIASLRKDTTPANREYFHRELHAALREIRDRYEKISRASRAEWEEWYKKKLVEIKLESESHTKQYSASREEVIRIRTTLSEMRERLSDLEARNQQLIKKLADLRFQEEEDLRLFETSLTEKEAAVQKMRAECTALTVQVDILCDNNTSLKLEITTYRKLMEQAEHLRLKTQEITFDSSLTRSHDIGTGVSVGSLHRIGSGIGVSSLLQKADNFITEIRSAHTSTDFQRSHQGDIYISEHSPDGKSITVVNLSTIRSHDLSNWRLVHYVKGAEVASFTFPVSTHIQPDQAFKVYARGQGKPYSATTFVCNDVAEFTFGSDAKTSLYNSAYEEVAWYAHHTYNH
ncbi:unnamed protein product [Caenorhabditis auriculariae]|uniref:Uncharacterized protein n=1 Tax=Caenorhabditis auriculariae TaxID=2777116 RepID=A0A8S1GZC4_9PELO|nr:unnamed protein product [Caenorhabditis auriculariae]